MAEKKTEAKPKAAPKPKAPPKPKDPVVISIKASQLTERELRFINKLVDKFQGRHGVNEVSDVALLCLKEYLSAQSKRGADWTVPRLRELARKL